MDAAAWGFVGALAGAIVGAGASVTTTVVTARSSADLQAQADVLERTERARAFQRDNLLAVQDALQDVARVAGRVHHEDLTAHRAGADWGKTLLSSELDEAALVANRRLTALVERIQDDSLREEIRATHSEFTWIAMARSQSDAEAHMAAGGEMFLAAMGHLGQVLRGLY